MTFYVVVENLGFEPWILNLQGYETVDAADQAIRWLRQFSRSVYCRLCVVRDGRLVYYFGGQPAAVGSAPYSEAEWSAFLERIRAHDQRTSE
jgi:predicted secreted Zn-dependent protease